MFPGFTRGEFVLCTSALACGLRIEMNMVSMMMMIIVCNERFLGLAVGVISGYNALAVGRYIGY